MESGTGVYQEESGGGRLNWTGPRKRGTSLGDLGQIQTLLSGLTCATQICISNFTGSDPSSPIEVAAAQHEVKRNKILYSELYSSNLFPCCGYDLPIPGQDRIGLSVVQSLLPMLERIYLRS